MPKKFGVNYLVLNGTAEKVFACMLAADKIISIFSLGNPPSGEPVIVAAKNDNKSTLKKIAKSL